MSTHEHEPRIPRLTVEEATRAAESVEIPAAFAFLNVFQILLHHPALAKAVTGLLTTLLFHGKLAPRLRELVILRIGWRTASEYEWTQHVRVSRDLGIPDEDIVGVREWRSYAGFGAADRAVLAATDETIDTGTIRDETWKECEAQVGGSAELLELVVAIGNWRLFSSMLRSLEIPLEEGLASWPPDGKAPPSRVHVSVDPTAEID